MKPSSISSGRFSVHPFPARMAPELAFDSLKRLNHKSVILDPMSGSGTVLRQANDLGLSAIGFDMDPLAVLMSKVWTTPVSLERVIDLGTFVLNEAKQLRDRDVHLDWMDDDPETKAFVEFWFGTKQLNQLRKLAYVLSCVRLANPRKQRAERNVLSLALSRIIITKEQCASLARDTSHSRPHRVATSSDYCCFEGFERSIKNLCSRLQKAPPSGGTKVALGDARKLRLEDRSVDAVVTSPPYLNAIDYMRGHRLSLVWLGYRLSTLRDIRSNTLGAERASGAAHVDVVASRMAMGEVGMLPSRYQRMIDRYISDVHGTVGEIARVLAKGGTATMVVGNSCLRGIYISNSGLVRHAAIEAGMSCKSQRERLLPESSRYLPTNGDGSLSKRMRTETVLTLVSQ
ncbi:hypothetical protein [Terriglobus sp. ADX1]|uniref:hypothetical protein n=1 Tax=Terriglobus sp. ADX1 TaxID=2794063 RepID=UPI002FE55FFF